MDVAQMPKIIPRFHSRSRVPQQRAFTDPRNAEENSGPLRARGRVIYQVCKSRRLRVPPDRWSVAGVPM
jgi:hypothetical protein